MIEVKNITKAYNGIPAIEDISVTFERGSIYGLVGYNGAGKTTLLKTMCGVLKPERGTILLDGQPVYDNPGVKNGLFLVSDDTYVLPQASMHRMARFYRGYYPSWNDDVFEKLIRIFKLDARKRIAGFSKGMQRQAFIIFALCVSPSFLLMDEAFDGIDPMMRDLVRQLLLEAIAERHMGIVISSHNLRELEDLCDRVGVINGKRIVYDMQIDDMRQKMNKYKGVFAEELDVAALLTSLKIPYRNLERNGKHVSFIAEGNADAVKTQLAAHSPLFLESLPLTLEEIFLIEMEAKTYDFSELFA